MADKEMLEKLKIERQQLIEKEKSIVAQIEEINEQIEGYKKTATYIKWNNTYQRAVKEVNREKKSKNMDMDKYQNMMREIKKMKKAYPLADVMKKKEGLVNSLSDVRNRIDENKLQVKNTKHDKIQNENQQPEVDENAAKIGVIEGLRQMAELQAAISRVQATERIKKITDAVADLSVNVEAKINLAALNYKKHRVVIENAKKEYEAKVNDIIDEFRESMVTFEQRKQDLEGKEIQCMSQIAMKKDEIEFRKKDESYKNWLSEYKRNTVAIKKLKSSKNMDMNLYQKLLKEHKELKAKNPLNKNIQEREEFETELKDIQAQINESKNKENEYYKQHLNALVEAAKERDNKLVVSQKQGIFKRVIGGIADRINSKKRVETGVITPLKQLTQRLEKVSQGLASKREEYLAEINPLINGEQDKKQNKEIKEPVSITEVIEKGKNAKQKIIAVIKNMVHDNKAPEKQITKNKQPATELSL